MFIQIRIQLINQLDIGGKMKLNFVRNTALILGVFAFSSSAFAFHEEDTINVLNVLTQLNSKPASFKIIKGFSIPSEGSRICFQSGQILDNCDQVKEDLPHVYFEVNPSYDRREIEAGPHSYSLTDIQS